tara:strand:+ start:573 stop:1070 length:498 start_codon:yes stop_codon:yes gene_type:complete
MALTLNGSSNTITPTSAVQPAGSVLQVVTTTTQANHTSTSSSYQNVSALNTAITPTASNSLLIAMLDISLLRIYENNSHEAQAFVSLSDDAGSSYLTVNGVTAREYSGDGIRIDWSYNLTHVKTAGSTSARTYYLYMKLAQGDAYEFNPAVNENFSTMSIWEIAQ